MIINDGGTFYVINSKLANDVVETARKSWALATDIYGPSSNVAVTAWKAYKEAVVTRNNIEKIGGQ